MDQAFTQVIDACANVSDRLDNTWITNDMRSAYTTLHQLGFAHSLEIWQEEQLIGGLYGLSLGRVFFGESMFHYTRDASKMALYHLCQMLSKWEFDFIDCQLPTPHLLSLGATELHRNEFLYRLAKALQHPTHQGSWQNE